MNLQIGQMLDHPEKEYFLCVECIKEHFSLAEKQQKRIGQERKTCHFCKETRFGGSSFEWRKEIYKTCSIENIAEAFEKEIGYNPKYFPEDIIIASYAFSALVARATSEDGSSILKDIVVYLTEKKPLYQRRHCDISLISKGWTLFFEKIALMLHQPEIAGKSLFDCLIWAEKYCARQTMVSAHTN